MYQIASPGPTQTTNQKVHQAALRGQTAEEPITVAVITAAEVEARGGRTALDLESDDMRALVKSAAIIAADNRDPDPESIKYRAALAAAQKAVARLATTDVMKSTPDGKPVQPSKEDVKVMRRADDALRALVAQHDEYWPLRWGREGNPRP